MCFKTKFRFRFFKESSKSLKNTKALPHWKTEKDFSTELGKILLTPDMETVMGAYRIIDFLYCYAKNYTTPLFILLSQVGNMSTEDLAGMIQTGMDAMKDVDINKLLLSLPNFKSNFPFCDTFCGVIQLLAERKAHDCYCREAKR